MKWLKDYIEQPLLLAITFILSLPIFWNFGKWLFGDFKGLENDIKNTMSPDWFALITGRYSEGEWSKLKIMIFVLTWIIFMLSLYNSASMLFA
ncbi:hypothetical protein [Desulforegula conservatrix]|uniref:hypothetical protein n=1 Tax=Desulforegula conservatrix TaxID=153026 RepID=UPI000481D7E8|nr:hypothetical protein [Desulforegula conservatrix]